MEIYDRNRLINNINHLLKERGIKNKDLETYAGVSPGYISRISADSNTSNPGIDYICKAANFFGIPFNVLIAEDLSAQSDDEILCRKFLQTLYDETMYNHIMWVPHTKEDWEYPSSNKSMFKDLIGCDKHDQLPCGWDGEYVDDIYSEDKEDSIEYMKELNELSKSWTYYYKSMVESGEYVEMKPKFYSATFESKTFIIACISYKHQIGCDDNSVKNIDAYEIWSVDEQKKGTPLFSTFCLSNDIKELVENILGMSISSESTFNLSDSSIKSIENFLLEVDD